MGEMIEPLRLFARRRGVIIGVCDGVHMKSGYDGSAVVPFENAKSVIVACVPIPPAGQAAEGEEPGGRPRGVIAAAMSGGDYHERVYGVLGGLVDFIKGDAAFGAYKDFEYKTQADDGKIAERPLAVMSGAAFQGLNRCVFTEEYGSYFNIGLLITSIPFGAFGYKPETAPPRYCLKCGVCKRACPSGALGGFDDENGGFEREKCVARLTMRRGSLTEEESRILGVRLWGCDVCQSVCPMNKGHVVLGEAPALDELTDIDEETFNSRFPAMMWRGVETLRRNARAVLKNIGQ